MSALDSDDDSKKLYLWWKPMAWLDIIRPTNCTNSSEKWLSSGVQEAAILLYPAGQGIGTSDQMLQQTKELEHPISWC